MRSNHIHRLNYILMLVPVLITHLVSAQWVRKADGLKPRSDLRETVVYKSKLYVFCGFSDTSRVTDSTSEIYDPSTNVWKYIAPIPLKAAVTHECAILVDNTIWLIGGRTGKNPGPLTSEIWIYNITTNSWSKGPSITDPATGKLMPIGAWGGVLFGRVIHLFGGFTPTACDNDQDKYHLTLDIDSWLANPSSPAKWENKLKPLPIKKNHFSSIVLGGKIYAMGGQLGHDCNGGLEVSSCHVYNPTTDTWKQITSLPTGRSHAEGSSFAIDGKIYMVGGQGSDGTSSKYVTIFDPSGNNGAGTWTENTSLTLPFIFEGLSAGIVGSTFVISHGSRGSSKYPRQETYTRSISRKPVYKFGFPSECLNLNTATGSSVKAHTWLYTIDSTKSYTTSSNAVWLTVSKNATGTAGPNAVDIEVTANTTGLAPGTYNASITATGTGSGVSYAAATLCVSLTVQQKDTSLVTNISSTTGRTYSLGHLVIGTTVFTDRTYEVTSVPAALINTALIKTPNDDKANSTAALFSFTINQNATVYAAYDPRAITIPSWLSGWKKLTGQQVGINDSKISYMQLYSKDFNAGTVSLGGNMQSPADGAQNNYFVIVQPQNKFDVTVTANGNGTVTTNPDQAVYDDGANVTLTAIPASGQQFINWSGDTSATANPLSITITKDIAITANFLPVESFQISNVITSSDRAYTISQLTSGEGVYSDRTYEATTIPDYLDSMPFIKTPNDDKAITSSTWLSFNVNQDATIYVAYDPREDALPAWLSGWQKSDDQIGINDSKISYMQLYSKNYPAGKVSLGANMASPATGAQNNYFVIAVPQQLQRKSIPNTQNYVQQLTGDFGLRSLNPATHITIFPNPFYGNKIYIKADNFLKHEAVTITLQSMPGSIVTSTKVITDDDGTFSRAMAVRHISRGLYIINAASASKKVQAKIVIN